jgi:hypothetical protein
MEIIKVADVSGGEVTNIYPPNTAFERVDLSSEPAQSSASLMTTTYLTIPAVSIKLDRESIEYGRIMLGQSSVVKTVRISNIGISAVRVTLEVNGADAIAQSFYEQSLYINGAKYNMTAVIANIPAEGSENVNTQLLVPPSWAETSTQNATFIFWADAAS